MEYLTDCCHACLCWDDNDGCLSTRKCQELEKAVEKEDKSMDTKKRLSEWTLAELSKYCKSMIEQDYPKCEKCEARGVCERTPNKWKFDTLTSGEKAIMRACGAKWVTMNDNEALTSVLLWDKKPTCVTGYYDGYGCIGSLDKSLFPSVSCGDCVELED